MSRLLKLTKPETILISMILALLLSVSSQFLILGILIIIFILMSILILDQFKTPNIFIALILIGFLTITSDLGESIRVVVNLGGIFTLFYIFLKKFGMRFSSFPKLPAYIVNFILLVIFSMLISTLFSANFSVGIIETSRQILFFVIVYIIYAFIESEDSIFIYIFSMIIVGIILSISVIYSFISSEKLIYLLATNGLVTDAGYFKNQAAVGGILVVSVSLTYTLIFSNHRKIITHKKLFIAILIMEFISLLLTNSRAAISACIISAAFITFILNRKIFKKILLRTTLFLSGLLFFFPQVIDVFLTFFRSGRVLENTRYILWDMAFEIYKDNPIFGVGPGLFRDSMYKHLNVMLGTWEESQVRLLYNEGSGVGLAHNFFISRITDMGLLGFLTAILLPILFTYTGIKLIKRMRYLKTDAYPIIVCVCGIGLGLFYRSFFEVTGLLSYGWITRDLPFWLMFLILIYYFVNTKQSVSTTNF